MSSGSVKHKKEREKDAAVRAKRIVGLEASNGGLSTIKHEGNSLLYHFFRWANSGFLTYLIVPAQQPRVEDCILLQLLREPAKRFLSPADVRETLICRDNRLRQPPTSRPEPVSECLSCAHKIRESSKAPSLLNCRCCSAECGLLID